MADVNYNDVALLLPMNGADGGTTFTDYSPTPKTVTVSGDAKTVTAQSKFYGSSGAFNGNGDYLRINANPAFNLYGALFTIQVWVYRVGTTAERHIVGYGNNTSSWWDFRINQSNNLVFRYNNNSGILTSSTGITSEQWNHVAACYDGTALRLFVNGSVVGSVNSGVLSANATLDLGIGANLYGGSFWYYWSGYLQDLQITKGIARYTEGFTPPGRLCGSISGTVYDAAGDPAQRTVIAVPRTYPCNVAWSTQSSAVDGTYSLTVPDMECSRIVLADETTLYNDLVDRVLPG